jgi:hypothetical protein
MKVRSTFRTVSRRGSRRGVAIIAVLYFLVVCAFTTAALLFVQRTAIRGAALTTNGARLLGAAEAGAFASIAGWDSEIRAGQVIGTAATQHLRDEAGIEITIFITRLGSRLYSVVGEASSAGMARRLELLVRQPVFEPKVGSALVSAVNVNVGAGVRFEVDSGACADTGAAITISPQAQLIIDPLLPVGDRPGARADSVAADSMTYLSVGGASWADLAAAADIRLSSDARVIPVPVVANGRCMKSDGNWGDITKYSPCASYAPVVYAPGDLTIEGGVGQGVLLVDGHLLIAGPFTYSGQIVARNGIETRADNIAISGVVYAWRGRGETTATRSSSNEITLTHATTLRYSRCDARHGIAPWLQPRRVRERAWSELF